MQSYKLIVWNFLLILLWACLGRSKADDGSISKFGNEIVTITEDILGTSAFKAHLSEGSKFHSDRLHADSIVRDLASNVNNKLGSREIAVKRLRSIVANSYIDSSWGSYKECCKFSEYDLALTYDSRFLGKVDVNSLCTMTSSLATNTEEVPNDDFLMAALKNLEEFPGLKAQYFGSDTGTLLSFPATGVQNCGTYDNRFRPWYVQASAPVPKDVVIAIDMSGSMVEENRMQAAIDAASTILDSLSPDDKVAVVGFSDNAYALGSKDSEIRISRKDYGKNIQDSSEPSCYDTNMVDATPRNIKHLTSVVSKMVPHGGTNYTKGLQIAFDFLFDAFKRDYSTSCHTGENNAREMAWSRHRTIIFLSDGKPSDRPLDILELIHRRNLELHNSVVLLCYALGKGTFGHFIRKMSQQSYEPKIKQGTCIPHPDPCTANGARLCNPPSPKEGLFKQVTDSIHLRSAMGSYYTFFAVGSSSESFKFQGSDFAKRSTKFSEVHDVIWSVPYYDAGGMGMVLTAASPIVIDGRLIGVVGADLTMRELMAEVTYFHAGGLASYAFILDVTGRVLLHPYMPSPSAVTDDPVLTDIYAFERSSEVKTFLQEILKDARSEDSQHNSRDQDETLYRKTVNTKRVFPQEHRSVTTKDAHLSYTCTITSHLVLCVVVDGNMASHTEFSPQDMPEDFSFLYHRFDIVPPDHLCLYENGVSSGVNSTVFLAPTAYLDVGKHMGQPVTSSWIRHLKEYMSDPIIFYIGSSPSEVAETVNLHQGVRDAVRITSHLDAIWNNKHVEHDDEHERVISDEELRRNVLFRYFSSENGVFRIHPGVQMPKMYNPMHRPWYEQARAFLFKGDVKHEDCDTVNSYHLRKCVDDVAISAPYLDASGAGVVITISQAIFAPTLDLDDHQPNARHIVGVMGGDFRLSFMGDILKAAVEECTEASAKCILIDLAGYVIYDEALTQTDESTLEGIVQTNYHITYAHQSVAATLVRHNVLVRKKCVDVSQVTYLEEYRVDLTALGKVREELPFRASYVNHTNTVLLIIKKDFWDQILSYQIACIYHELSSASCTRRSLDGAQCESPCVNVESAERDYGVCTNTFDYTWTDHPPPCVPDKFIDERISIVVDQHGDIEASDLDLDDCFTEGKHAASKHTGASTTT